MSKSYDATSHFETTTGNSEYLDMCRTMLMKLQMISRTFTSVLKAKSWLLRV